MAFIRSNFFRIFRPRYLQVEVDMTQNGTQTTETQLEASNGLADYIKDCSSSDVRSEATLGSAFQYPMFFAHRKHRMFPES